MYTEEEFESILTRLTPGCTGFWCDRSKMLLAWVVNHDNTTIRFENLDHDQHWAIYLYGTKFAHNFSNICFPNGTPILPIVLSTKDKVTQKIDYLWKRSKYSKNHLLFS